MISLLTQLFVFAKDRFGCVYCGRASPQVELVVARDLPRSRGGGDDLRNLYTACRDCCLEKGPRTASEYLTFLSRRQELLGRLNRHLDSRVA